ncbi:hypothetical protein AAVH_22323 [Aphelenchoides avenae]|nr:hypothetical protein AAVH_22323 [Aphelenchus avenae]
MQSLFLVAPVAVVVLMVSVVMANDDVADTNDIDAEQGVASYISTDYSDQPAVAVAQESLARLRRSQLRNYLRVGRSGNLRNYMRIGRSSPSDSVVVASDPSVDGEPMFRQQRNNLRNLMRIGKRSVASSDPIRPPILSLLPAPHQKQLGL